MNKRVLAVVMDGVGEREDRYGNAVRLAWTPTMNWLKTHGLYTTASQAALVRDRWLAWLRNEYRETSSA